MREREREREREVTERKRKLVKNVFRVTQILHFSCNFHLHRIKTET